MNKYLETITKQILFFSPKGLSKVRLAKLIYFVHKGLIQKGIASSKSLAFIRMPLGPVPDGFKNLANIKGIKIKEESVGLTYNRQTYFIKEAVKKPNKTILKILKSLENSTTSDLVKYTHLEPSWIANSNGKIYYISEEDLRRTLPLKNWANIDIEADNQRLQALLIKGMIEEIVDESTSLEYPQEKVE